MSDEIELLTTNAAGDSWVDLTPSAVSTGYQAQNTNIEANRNGVDSFSPYYNDTLDTIICPISGILDEAGLPFAVKTEISLDASGMVVGTKYYLRLTAGSTTTKRSLTLTTEPGTYDSGKNGYYYDGDRISNAEMVKDTSTSMLFGTRLNRHNTAYDMDQEIKTTSDVEFKEVTSLFKFSDILTGSNIVKSSVALVSSDASITVFTIKCPCSGSLSVSIDLSAYNGSSPVTLLITGGNSTLSLSTSVYLDFETKTGTVSFEFNDTLTVAIEGVRFSYKNLYLKGSREPSCVENVFWDQE